ncbi:helix-turn-helix domain-containing protein [Amycolatopsis sp. NPDC001319]|uniref:helix-turn-helix domain-containing protein n=1 Tax=unclassified Amycolatopsis TaxID=2618356 RepID=UPI00368C059C
MTTPAVALGRHLRGLREQLGLTQVAVAKLMQCSSGHVNMIEQGQRDMRISTVIRYCDAIGARVHIGFPTKEGDQ